MGPEGPIRFLTTVRNQFTHTNPATEWLIRVADCVTRFNVMKHKLPALQAAARAMTCLSVRVMYDPFLY